MLKTYNISVGVITHNKKLLLLKRSSKRLTSPNLWEFVSGRIHSNELPENTVKREIKEETNLKGNITKIGKSFIIIDNWGKWNVHPFLIEVDEIEAFNISKEHTKFKWIVPEDIVKFKCVAGIEKDLSALGVENISQI